VICKMVKYCPHCGSKVQEGTKYCSSCGKELVKKEKSIKLDKKHYIIIAEAVIIIALITGVGVYGALTYFNNNMKTMDFGAFTMSVPANANLINNSSGLEGGCQHWIDPNSNDTQVYYANENSWYGLGASLGSYDTVMGGELITSDKLTQTNCTMSKEDKYGKTMYFGYYNGGDFSITIRADSLDHLVTMLNSIQIKGVASSSSSSSSGSRETNIIIINDSSQDNSTTNTDTPTPVEPINDSPIIDDYEMPSY